MDRHYFTIDETNRLIPELEDSFRRIVQMHAQVRETWERLDDAGLAPDSDDFDIDEDTPAEGMDDLATLRMLFDGLHEEIERVQSTGCVIKRLDTGLVDWYAHKDGREVLLCWQLGEKEVAHWHELDAGFNGRRPISEL